MAERHKRWTAAVVGAALTLLLAGVLLFGPNEVSPLKRQILGVFCALSAGALAYLVSGILELAGSFKVLPAVPRLAVRASGGFAVFVVVLVWWSGFAFINAGHDASGLREDDTARPRAGVSVGRDLTARAEPGGTLNLAGRDVVIGITVADYEEALKKREAEIRAKMNEPRARSAEEERRLETELAIVLRKQSALEHSLNEQTEMLRNALEALQKLSKYVTEQERQEVQRELEHGSVQTMEALFARVVEIAAPAESAEAAYWLGKLAESRADLITARGFYLKALELAPADPRYRLAAEALAAKETGQGGSSFPTPPARPPSVVARPGPSNGKDVTGQIADPGLAWVGVGQVIRVLGRVSTRPPNLHYWLVLELADGRFLPQPPELEIRDDLTWSREVVAKKWPRGFTLALYLVTEEEQTWMEGQLATAAEVARMPGGRRLAERYLTGSSVLSPMK